MKVWLWRTLAVALVLVGFIGVVLPGLPTVVFWIVAAWAAGHGWPRLELWLLQHPRYGVYIRNWRRDRSVPRRAKYLAVATMALSLALVFYSAPSPYYPMALAIVLLLAGAWLWTRPEPDPTHTLQRNTMTENVHQFSARSLKGENINLADYRGQWVLVVNTASECGLTPQYEGLEKLYKDYADKGLTILGFPCNQFGGQEPGSAEEIQQGCLLNYGVSFPMFEKIEVNGDEAHPLYRYLKEQLPGTVGKRIKWNFTKFLVDPEGNPVKRYAPTTKPEKIEKDLRQLMGVK